MIQKYKPQENPCCKNIIGERYTPCNSKNLFFADIKSAFTMVETLVVVIVLGIIATLIIPGLVNKQRISINRTKVRKAMSVYEAAINKMIIENDIRSIEALNNWANNVGNCENTNAYFKIVKGEGCTFKTADGLWWNIQEIDRTIISMKEINDSKQGNTLAETLTKANNAENYEAFILVTNQDNNGSFRINDLAWEKANDAGTENLVAKLYNFMQGINSGNNQSTKNDDNPVAKLLSTIVGDDGSYERFEYDAAGNKILRFYNCGSDGVTGCNSQKFDYDGGRITAQYNNCGKDGTKCLYPYYKYVYEQDGDNTIVTEYKGCSNSSGTAEQTCTGWTITTRNADGDRIAEQECTTSSCKNVKYYANVNTYDAATGNTTKSEYYNYCESDGSISKCRSYSKKVYDSKGSLIAEYSTCTKSTGVCSNSKLYVYDYENNTKTAYEDCRGTEDINNCDNSKTVTYQLTYQ